LYSYDSVVQHGGPASRTIIRVAKRSTLHGGHDVQKRFWLDGLSDVTTPHAFSPPHVHCPPAYASKYGCSFNVAHAIGFSSLKLVVCMLKD
jgi:hypothetical protein